MKLRAQARVRSTLLVCLVAPFIFVFLLDQQDRVPKDTIYGRFVHATGYAVPLMLLGFAAQWVFPLLTSIVSGDIFASEDQHGTWKSILTRSQGRVHIFWGKVLAATIFTLAVVTTLAISTLIGGVLLVGSKPLESLSGTPIAPGHAFWLVLAAWACAIPPLLGFTAVAILFSVLSRNTAVGIVGPIVVGLLMQLYSFLNGVDIIRHGLLATAFDSWHGLLAGHAYYAPLVRGSITSVVYIVVCLSSAYAVFRRRDITGG